MPTVRKKSPKKPVRKVLGRLPKYSDACFWNLVGTSFRTIGQTTVTQALALFYTLQDKRTPTAARLTIVGALAYLILPIDVIPDFIPIVGFTDDMAAIAAAVGAVRPHMTPLHQRKAARKAKELFA